MFRARFGAPCAGPIPRRIKGLRIFPLSTRAHPRVRERSTYAVPQILGVFVIKGSTTTLVKDDSARRNDDRCRCKSHFILPRKPTLCFSKYANICDDDFGCAKLRQFCRSLAQIILNTRFSTAPKNTTSSWPANSSACIALPLRRSTVFLSSGFCCDLCDHGEHPGDRAWLSPRYRS